jgi:hypothetical protein
MDIQKLTEGKVVRYKARVHEGKGKIIQVYRQRTGTWVIVHDKARNTSVTVRPSQVFAR